MNSIMAASTSSTLPQLSQWKVFVIAVCLIALALVIVLSPIFLSAIYKRKTRDVNGECAPASFFQVPYINWFLIHYGIAALGIVAVVLLGLFNVIENGTVSALLGGLFGYVLGSSATGHKNQTDNSIASATKNQQTSDSE